VDFFGDVDFCEKCRVGYIAIAVTATLRLNGVGESPRGTGVPAGIPLCHEEGTTARIVEAGSSSAPLLPNGERRLDVHGSLICDNFLKFLRVFVFEPKSKKCIKQIKQKSI